MPTDPVIPVRKTPLPDGPEPLPVTELPEIGPRPEIDAPRIEEPPRDLPEIEAPAIDRPEIDRPEIDRGREVPPPRER